MLELEDQVAVLLQAPSAAEIKTFFVEASIIHAMRIYILFFLVIPVCVCNRFQS